MLDTLKELCKKLRGGSYFVKRGPINWAEFPFEKYPRAIAILVDDQTFISSTGIQKASMSIEVAGSMPSPKDNPEVDDGLLDEFFEDVSLVLLSLREAKQGRGEDPVVFDVTADATATEFHDSTLKVQGIMVFFRVQY